MSEKKILLTEKEIPEKWYNIMADMPNKPLPPFKFHWDFRLDSIHRPVVQIFSLKKLVVY